MELFDCIENIVSEMVENLMSENKEEKLEELREDIKNFIEGLEDDMLELAQTKL